MPIHVICPGCHARFEVSDKFAGQTGPCPKCKFKITIPAATVEVHAPTAFESGGRGIDGKLVLKPIEREDVRVTPLGLGIVLGTIVLTAAVAYLAGGMLESHLWLRAIGTLLISPVLAFGGYAFLRDMEAEKLEGIPLYYRCLGCGAAYTVLWGVFGYAVASDVLSGGAWHWLLLAPPLLVTGALTALALFNFDFFTGLLHYLFYVLVFIVLRWLIGMGWIWQIGLGS